MLKEKLFYNQKGGAFLIAMIFSSLLIMVSVGILSASTFETKIAANNTVKKMAQYAAEAGVENARSQLKNEFDWRPQLNEKVNLSSGEVFRYVYFSENDAYRTVEVEGGVTGSPIVKKIRLWLHQGLSLYTVLAGGEIKINGIKSITNASVASNTGIDVSNTKKIKGVSFVVPSSKTIAITEVHPEEDEHDDDDDDGDEGHYSYTKNYSNSILTIPVVNRNNFINAKDAAIVSGTRTPYNVSSHVFKTNPVLFVNGNAIIDGIDRSDDDSDDPDEEHTYDDGKEDQDKDDEGHAASGMIIYATGMITVNCKVDNSVIIAEGDVTVNKDFKGLIYSGGKIILSGKTEFAGSMIAQRDINFNNDIDEEEDEHKGRIDGGVMKKFRHDDDDDDDEEHNNTEDEHDGDDDREHHTPGPKEIGPAEEAMELLNKNVPDALTSTWSIVQWQELN